MPNIQQSPVTTVADYVECIRQYVARNGCKNLWYRGSAQFPLTPSLIRHNDVVNANTLMDMEAQIMQRFKERSYPFLMGQHPTDDWQWLFLMQHHGTPTRLLDWTENAMMALYFGVTTALNTSDQDSYVWLIQPDQWNSAILMSSVNLDRPPKIYSPNEEDQIRMHKPGSAGFPPHALAMYGYHNSPRIVSQRGVFVVFGGVLTPLDEYFEQSQMPAEILYRAHIQREHLAGLRAELATLGYSESMIYPDLPGLATEVKYEFGF